MFPKKHKILTENYKSNTQFCPDRNHPFLVVKSEVLFLSFYSLIFARYLHFNPSTLYPDPSAKIIVSRLHFWIELNISFPYCNSSAWDTSVGIPFSWTHSLGGKPSGLVFGWRTSSFAISELHESVSPCYLPKYKKKREFRGKDIFKTPITKLFSIIILN